MLLPFYFSFLFEKGFIFFYSDNLEIYLFSSYSIYYFTYLIGVVGINFSVCISVSIDFFLIYDSWTFGISSLVSIYFSPIGSSITNFGFISFIFGLFNLGAFLILGLLPDLFKVGSFGTRFIGNGLLIISFIIFLSYFTTSSLNF